MSEQAIFCGALEHDNPASRAAYVEAACAGNARLRERIEELLASHAHVGDFLDATLIEQAAAADLSLSFLEPADTPGTLGRLDHYDVLEVLGQGGMSVVLKARDSKLRRIVALKVLARHLAVSSVARRQFVLEAQAAAAVRDEHVVTIYAVHDEGPRPYLAMEFIPGTTLEERLHRGVPLPLDEAVRIGVQIACGLAAAHDQGLVHRDVKPGNILLEEGTGRVKITDFGLAQPVTTAASGGMIAGTPMYMSPEQARGAPLDARSDLFSLGSVLYVMCTGRTPFPPGDAADILRRVAAAEPPPSCDRNPRLPARLRDLIARLHAKEPGARPATAREVSVQLSHGLAELQRTSPRHWRRRVAVAGLLGFLVAVALLVPYVWRNYVAAPAGFIGQPVSLDLHREDIPSHLLALAGDGNPAHALPELAAVLGDGRFLLPQTGGVNWMQQSPDGEVLAVPLNEDVALFATHSGEYLRTLKGPGGRVVFVTCSHDSRLLAATTWHDGAQGAVRVWDLQANQELFTKPVADRRVSGATAFSLDGKCLVTEGQGRIHVWDARTGKVIQTLDGLTGGLGGMEFSPNGRRLAVAQWHGKTVAVFAWDGAKLTHVRTLDGHGIAVTAVAYSPNGKYLATGDQEAFKLWDAETLNEIRTEKTPAQQLAFTPDSRTLFAAATNVRPMTVHVVTRWPVDRLEKLPPLAVELAAPDYVVHRLCRDGKVLFVAKGGQVTHVQAIDTVSGKERYPRVGHVAPLHAVAVNADGTRVASAGEDHVVCIWDLASRRVLHTLNAHTATVCALAFSPDGRLVASGSRDGTIVLWELDHGTEVRTLHGDAESFFRIQFSPDGHTLAAGGQGGLVKRWDTATGKLQPPLQGHTGVVRSIAFSRDGDWLASGGEDHAIHLYDRVGTRAQSFHAPGAVNDMAFSADGQTLAAVGEGPQPFVYLRDLAAGEAMTLPLGAGAPRGVAISPSSPIAATAGDDGTVRFWSIARGAAEPVRAIGPGPFGGPVRAIAFTPDGRYLATANANGMVYLLHVPAVR